MSVQAAESARLGPFRIVGTADAHACFDGARRRIARDDRTGRTAVLLLPAVELAEDPGYRVRFRAEAENSRRLTGFWAAPVIDIAPAHEDLPWVAYDCFPALSLEEALAASKGPLPEPTVRALGTVLAQALAGWHASGLVHAGISPATTLLMADGPRLTGYGLVRAAALDGSERAHPPGVDPFSLPPEQRGGGRPRPAGDVYALGAVLSYAATGRADLSYASRAALPEAMGGLITACLSADPEARPQPVTVARELSASWSADASGGLPTSVVAALGELAAAYPAEPPGSGAEAATEPRTAARPGPSRRAVTIGALSGVAGLGLGAGAVAGWRAAGEEPGPRATNLRGIAPAPLWRYDFGGELQEDPLLWQGRIALVNTLKSVTALTLRTGRALWSRHDLYPDPLSTIVLLGDGTFISPDTSAFSAVSLSTGRIKWVERRYNGMDAPSVSTFLAADKNALWFLIQGSSEEGASADECAVVAYDLKKRKERWRTPLPEAFQGDDGDTVAFLLESMILVPRTGETMHDGPVSYLALDRRNGRKLWTRTYRGEDDSPESRLVTPGNLLITCDGDGMRAHDIVSGKERWRVRTGRTTAGAPVMHGRSVYVTDMDAITYAVDVRSGKPRWRRRSPVPLNSFGTSGETAVSHAGTTVFQSTEAEIEALDASNGALKWRFAPADREQATAFPGRVVGTAPGMAFVLSDRVLYALPVD
ncbi:PQQ-binding-like beta-propeller repeat protein [Streptomyces sp. NPDC005962]|uniref:outer membrane protein assembly factor BamB family protein n=1 Tax=Streptomyces sp. NPDC005962 TaxID=3154466 RepID=UPI0033FE5242